MPVVPPKSAAALAVGRGQVLRVADVEGRQVADFVCFNARDYDEFFSQAKTRVNNWKARISTGDRLFSNRNAVMFTIVEDTVGVHDLLFSPCSSYIYEHYFAVGPRDGCLENLAAALAAHGIDKDAVPDPFNIFMNTGIDEAGRLLIRRAPSRAGDHLDLRAEIDCLVAVSACAEDLSECNGGACTPIRIEVLS